MNIVLGFGATEKEFEEQEEAAFRDFVIAKYRELNLSYISDEFVKVVEKWSQTRSAAFRAQTDAYKTAADYPRRYSYIYTRVASSPSDIVLIVTFHHINRRHALSLDGWALFQTSRLFHVDTYEAYDKERAA